MVYIKEPMDIEKESFRIIETEVDPTLYDSFNDEEKMVVKRVIHTTADFEYASLLRFKHDPIAAAKGALSKGIKIYADTNMIKAGVNPRTLKRLGCEIVNFVAEEDVIREAKERGITRSMVSMEKAFTDPQVKGYLIGNAPTALFTLTKAIEEGRVKPDFVVAVPVGFVGAAESKDDFDRMDVPFIVVHGRKGGSTVAVACLNAIFYLMDDQR
jgi:precorrin-8X/cobalt-precorrin-8 methylmutase